LCRDPLLRVLNNSWFCNGSLEEVLVGIVDAKMLNDKELEQLSKKIEAARRTRK